MECAAIPSGDKANDTFEAAAKFFQSGQLDQAVGVLENILRANPENFDAVIGLAVIHAGRGDVDAAIPLFEKATNIRPGDADAHFNLARALGEQGRSDAAITSYEKAIALEPEFADAYSNLGNMFDKLERLEDAIASYRKAIALKPDSVEAYSNLGNIFDKLGRLEDAAACHQKAISINPEFAGAHSNLGSIFDKLRRLEDAVACYQKAISLKPDFAEAHNNLGVALQKLGRLDDAIGQFRTALTIKPDYVEAGKSLLYITLNVPGLTPKDLFAEHLDFAKRFARQIAPLDKHFPNDAAPDRRLRVGYLSSDFRVHPLGHNVLPLLSSHDREKFEVFCYADVPRPDAMTEQFQSVVDHWRSVVGKMDSEVAGMVRADAIDVLVCLGGRFDRNRPLVPAHRAAPVQVSLFDGATSGLEEMDYWLTDGFLHPPDTKELFTEELHRLPVLYQYPPIEDAPAVEALPVDQAGFVTFGSFNNPAKINQEVIGLWAKVLKSVPGSRLMLKYWNLYGYASVQDRVLESFQASGVGPDRILFEASPDTFTDGLRRYGAMDIALDTFPFNGATTTFEALWMGVPVVSLAGETFISRMSASMLHHVGLGDLGVATPEAYVACVRDLAGDLARLRTLRAGLRDQVTSSPLCNAPAYALSVEAAYEDMWRKWCAQPNTSQHHAPETVE